MAHIVVLGSGPAGVQITHKLLKTVGKQVRGAKITLVSPSTHLFWNLAAPRAAVGGLKDEEIFYDLRPAFKQYSADQFEFVQGNVTSLDTAGNLVQVALTTGNTVSIPYDHVIIATGSSYNDNFLLKSSATLEETSKTIHRFSDQVEAAQSVTVAGAGSTGVELAGELGEKYGKTKKITLVVGRDQVLPGLADNVRRAAEHELEKLNVTLVHSARVTSYTDKLLTLSNGKSIQSDVYIPAYGSTPNSQFVPSQYLDEQKNVKVDKKLRVDGLSNAWAIGDVANIETKQALPIPNQVSHLGANVLAVLTDKPDAVKNYTPSSTKIFFVNIGSRTGAGQFGNWKVPNFLVGCLKARTLLIGRAPGMVDGSSA